MYLNVYLPMVIETGGNCGGLGNGNCGGLGNGNCSGGHHWHKMVKIMTLSNIVIILINVRMDI